MKDIVIVLLIIACFAVLLCEPVYEITIGFIASKIIAFCAILFLGCMTK